MAGCRTAQCRMTRPARCGRRSAATVSTSGSSGTWIRQSGHAYDCELLHVGPVVAGLRFDLDAGFELVGTCHDARHHLGEAVEFGPRDLEHELIVDLEDHPAGK